MVLKLVDLCEIKENVKYLIIQVTGMWQKSEVKSMDFSVIQWLGLRFHCQGPKELRFHKPSSAVKINK